ncbi:MAG: hypothetical protein JO093_01150 [Acidobacteria bacterium]|nr:hypothetical protein [Acidobacteriota bacterium]MBV9184189.1 hypothetical protein [Acidobacteriota bacterium]
MFNARLDKRVFLDRMVTGHASVEVIPTTTQSCVAAGGEPDGERASGFPVAIDVYAKKRAFAVVRAGTRGANSLQLSMLPPHGIRQRNVGAVECE